MRKFLLWPPRPRFGRPLGGEGQWSSHRKTGLATIAPARQALGYAIVKPPLPKPHSGCRWQFSARGNPLFDRRHADPAADTPALPSRDRFTKNECTFQVNAVFRF
ncbi:MAG: hypothetical protein JNL84_09685 [Candidatus Accumulibacter sp.]|nr:hypothetical protein [Accumulibacter sp.]